jgi:hypothetical protein
MPVRIRTLARICACLLVITCVVTVLIGLGPLGLRSDQLALLGRIGTGLLLLVGLSIVAIAGLRVSWSRIGGAHCTIEPAPGQSEPSTAETVIQP